MQKIKNSSAYVIYKLCRLLDSSVAKLDPLGLNKSFAKEFPIMSEKGETAKLIALITSRVHDVGYERIISLDSVSAMAALRDLSMFASALNRWNIPLSQTPLLEDLLLALAEATHELPVDTVFTYGPRNPKGEYRRTFTTCPEEKLFIDSFSEGMKSLSTCVAGTEVLQNMDPANPNFAGIAQEVADHFVVMVKSIVAVRKNVPPEVFTNQLRPFFEPKVVGGKKYFAPGGAQMPICLMDLIIWGINCDDIGYIRYWNEGVEYLPAAIRSKLPGILSKPSVLLTLQSLDLSKFDKPKVELVRASIGGVVEILAQLEKFRQPHLRVAKDNMKIRQSGSVGSGGYDTEILEYLLRKTKQAHTELLKLKEDI